MTNGSIRPLSMLFPMMKKELIKNTSTKPAMRNSTETRDRIFAAARRLFSKNSYENVGMRDIAAVAEVDAALVSRYFGNKENLFGSVIEGAFQIDEHLPGQLAGLGVHLVTQVMGDERDDRGDFDALRLLLLAAASPATAAVVSAKFHEEFVKPLAKLLQGRNTELRAALIGSYVIGLATMRHALHSPMLAKAIQSKAVEIAGAAIQACVNEETN